VRLSSDTLWTEGRLTTNGLLEMHTPHGLASVKVSQ
jgi:hypothetical protein